MDIDKIAEQHRNGKTLAELARDFDCSADKVRYHLKKSGNLILRKPSKCYLPEEQVINLYTNDVSVEAIAEKYGVSVGPVVRILKKHDIRKPNWLKNLSYSQIQDLLNREYFQKVVDEQISQKNIIDFLGCGQDQVVSLCKHHGIKLQNSGMSRSLLNRKEAEYELSLNNFKKLYVEKRLTISEVAEKFAISLGYLRRLITDDWKSGHLMRTTGESIASEKYGKYKDDRDYLLKMVKEGLTLSQMCARLECGKDVLSKALKKHDIYIPIKYQSTAEKEIGDFVSSLVHPKKVQFCDKKIIWPKELDIYVPSHKLAIEFCGLYWHGENQGKDKYYHLEKLEKCGENGVQLITIFEDEYNHKKEIVLSKIEQILGRSEKEKVNARECSVVEISPNAKRDFLNRNHLQGNDRSQVRFGLMDKHKRLVSVMTFARPSRVRASNRMLGEKGLWELNRFATDINLNVRGAAGKLLAHFKRNYEWDEIYSYADRRWSNGDLYNSLGFQLSSISQPNYWYLPPRPVVREYRFKYAKHRLVQEGFPVQESEREIMSKRGYDRIWDCGTVKFALENLE